MPASCRIDTEKYKAVLFDLDGVIAVTTTLPEKYLTGADDIMPSFADIEDCLARRLGRAEKAN